MIFGKFVLIIVKLHRSSHSLLHYACLFKTCERGSVQQNRSHADLSSVCEEKVNFRRTFMVK
jgi:hypothetical protein